MVKKNKNAKHIPSIKETRFLRMKNKAKIMTPAQSIVLVRAMCQTYRLKKRLLIAALRWLLRARESKI